jgi:EmrB/QacA subfamily drug resistance transporter
MCLSLLIVVIDSTVLNTALPTLARVLPASTTDLQWITDAYSLVFAALLIVAGALGDRFGRRRALMVGLTIFGAGSVAAALSGDAATLIATRAVMGLGAAFVMPATLSIINAVFPVRERAGAIGAWSAVAGLGVVAGPSLGGLLLDHFYWGSVFWLNIPLVGLALASAVAVVPDLAGNRGRGRLDILGAVLSAAGLIAIVDAIIEGADRGWTSATTTVEIAAGLAFFAAFVARELHTANPLLDVRLFRHRAFSAATLSISITTFALFGALFALTQYLQLVVGYSPLSAGLRALPFAAGVMAVAPISSVLVRAVGARVIIPLGLTAMSAGLFVLAQIDTTSGYGIVALGIAIMGVGMGLILAPAGESIMSVLPPEQAGVGSAVNDTVQELGGSLGVAVIGSIVSAAFRHGLDHSHLPKALVTAARPAIANADATAAHAGPAAHQLIEVAHRSFTEAMTSGFTVAAIVAIVGAALAAAALPNKPAAANGDQPVTADAVFEPAQTVLV